MHKIIKTFVNFRPSFLQNFQCVIKFITGGECSNSIAVIFKIFTCTYVSLFLSNAMCYYWIIFRLNETCLKY